MIVVATLKTNGVIGLADVQQQMVGRPNDGQHSFWFWIKSYKTTIVEVKSGLMNGFRSVRVRL